MSKLTSWVWDYAQRIGDKAYCKLCGENENNEFSCRGGTTGSLGRHLMYVHDIHSRIKVEKRRRTSTSEPEGQAGSSQPQSSSPELLCSQSPRKRKRRTRSNTERNNCSNDNSEIINRALTKLIVDSQLPISFCSSQGLKEFMEVVAPDYTVCKEDALKKRLITLKTNVETKIKAILATVATVACSTDDWLTWAQKGYITLTVHTLDKSWVPKKFTLGTFELDHAHLNKQIEDMCEDWDIGDKMKTIVSDCRAIGTKQTDAAQALQLALNIALLDTEIQRLILKSDEIVAYFKRTNALNSKQKQLGLPETNLLESCKTRWNSIYLMLQHLLLNKIPVSNVLTTQELKLTKKDWIQIEALVTLLKPLQMLTTVLCDSPISMVRPLIKKCMETHMSPRPEDDSMIKELKSTLKNELNNSFHLIWDIKDIVTMRQIASFLDPRYKDLHHEYYQARPIIRDHVKQLLNCSTESVEDSISMKSSALACIYQEEIPKRDYVAQWNEYLTEPQIRFDLDPFEWWKTRIDKYPAIESIARQYLGIPASSPSSERAFSTERNLVTPQRSLLLPENVDLLVFLYQNRDLL